VRDFVGLIEKLSGRPRRVVVIGVARAISLVQALGRAIAQRTPGR